MWLLTCYYLIQIEGKSVTLLVQVLVKADTFYFHKGIYRCEHLWMSCSFCIITVIVAMSFRLLFDDTITIYMALSPGQHLRDNQMLIWHCFLQFLLGQFSDASLAMALRSQLVADCFYALCDYSFSQSYRPYIMSEACMRLPFSATLG